MSGSTSWVYFGGGTPNTLKASELGRILGAIREQVEVNAAGVELLPAKIDQRFLSGLQERGFNRISVGIESFSKKVLSKTGRQLKEAEHTRKMIEKAKDLGLSVNADMMVGLPGQDSHIFLQDVAQIAEISPNQVTIYPYMTIRGTRANPSMSTDHQIDLIERAGHVLSGQGYDRKAVWTFALTDNIYDSSRDELTEEYAGFGPAAFSTYGSWKVVNPELWAYLDNASKEQWKGFVARNSRESSHWRRFARMIYDLNFENSDSFPLKIRLFIGLLRAFGYGRNGRLTEKGVKFAHKVSKTVVESLPFPVQNPDCVVNHDSYLEQRAGPSKISEIQNEPIKVPAWDS